MANSTTPTTEPAEITAGDSITWARTLADYPASDWTLKYRLLNSAGHIDITAAADGDDHLVSISTTTSAAYTAGQYSWFAYVEKTGERITIARGDITIRANPLTATTYDGRTEAERILDGLRAAYETYTATNGHVQEYEIAGRRMKYRSAAEILQQISYWESRVAAERRVQRIANGGPRGNRILVRM